MLEFSKNIWSAFKPNDFLINQRFRDTILIITKEGYERKLRFTSKELLFQQVNI